MSFGGHYGTILLPSNCPCHADFRFRHFLSTALGSLTAESRLFTSHGSRFLRHLPLAGEVGGGVAGEVGGIGGGVAGETGGGLAGGLAGDWRGSLRRINSSKSTLSSAYNCLSRKLTLLSPSMTSTVLSLVDFPEKPHFPEIPDKHVQKNTSSNDYDVQT
jgi:hypothetical protein